MKRSRSYRKRRLLRRSGIEKKSIPERVVPSIPHFHLRRAQAQLIVDNGVGTAKVVVPAIVLLHELNPNGVNLFSQQPFGRNQLVTVNIPGLRNFFVKGRVVGCKELHLNASILSRTMYGYRMELQFEFRSQAEQDSVRQFCHYLNSEEFDKAA